MFTSVSLRSAHIPLRSNEDFISAVLIAERYSPIRRGSSDADFSSLKHFGKRGRQTPSIAPTLLSYQKPSVAIFISNFDGASTAIHGGCFDSNHLFISPTPLRLLSGGIENPVADGVC